MDKKECIKDLKEKGMCAPTVWDKMNMNTKQSKMFGNVAEGIIRRKYVDLKEWITKTQEYFK